MAEAMAGIGHYHLSVKSVGRAGGGGRVASAAAAYRSGGVVLKAAAYRSAEVTIDRATGQVFDYTRKQGVLETHILTPASVVAPDWVQNRNRLWNAAERAEPRKNGRIATEIEVALPHQLSREQNRALVLGYAQGIADRYGVVADVAIHQGHDARNIHAHILFSHREITEQGFGDLSNRHTVEKSGKAVQLAGIAAQSRDVEALRAGWGRHVNRAYEGAGQELQVDHRSYQRQGRDLTPTRYLGPKHSDPERARLRETRAAYNQRVLARRPERERQALDRAHQAREQRQWAPAEKPDLAQLRALDDRALEREASLDRVHGGGKEQPATVDDISRQMAGPAYQNTIKELAELKSEETRAAETLRQDRLCLDHAINQWRERRDELGAARLYLHDKGLWRDPVLTEIAGHYNTAAAMLKRTEVAGQQRTTAIKIKEKQAERALAIVRPYAELRLPALQQRASAARTLLSERQREHVLARQRAEQRWTHDRERALAQAWHTIRQEWAHHPERAAARRQSPAALAKEAALAGPAWQPVTIEDIARTLSPTYAAAVADEKKLAGTIDKTDAALAEQVRHQQRHTEQRAERWQQMGGFARAMHRSGLYRDATIERHETNARQAARMTQQLTLTRQTLTGTRDEVSCKAAAALAAVRPKAARILANRQQRAGHAKSVLQERQDAQRRLHRVELEMERQREEYGLEPRYRLELQYGHSLRDEQRHSRGHRIGH